ncbi:ATP-dependent DNA helicase [Psychrosphaera aestuarii]|uniref:ATP-dependent DNA helicase n=1 Tax=Psychrosphaera aestuarii TaxID=1266052 RepID=UPI001FD0754B|nr:ATP-binding domain-containing protein [Psychrosphaera aestuarii]
MKTALRAYHQMGFEIHAVALSGRAAMRLHESIGFITSTIANTKLDIVKRKEGTTGIPEYSKLINQGIVPDNLSSGAIYFHQTERDDIARVCCDLYQQSPSDSRIMAPTKKLVADINKLTQEAVNSNGKLLEFTMHGEQYYQNLRLNDQILFTQNHYDKGIQNGSLGTLTNVEFYGDIYGAVTLDTGEVIEVNQPVLDCMELGYAITLHKAQGSQFPRIIIALQKGRIVDRAWLYTAITRAEAEVHIVGNKSEFQDIIKVPSNASKRNSYLVDLLKKI